MRREQAVHACQIARDVLSIAPRDGATITELESIQSDACLVLAAHGTELSPEQVDSFQTGTHPWCHLLRLIREQDSLSDADWSSLNRSIEMNLGRALAIAATRGRLAINRPVEQRLRLLISSELQGRPSENHPSQRRLPPLTMNRR